MRALAQREGTSTQLPARPHETPWSLAESFMTSNQTFEARAPRAHEARPEARPSHDHPSLAARAVHSEAHAPSDGGFTDLGLCPQLLRAMVEVGYERPTPIQTQAIPPLLQGHDLLGCARTGTGKTAAFALPILQRLTAGVASDPGGGRHRDQRSHSSPARARGTARALVLVPTRELAAQVGQSFSVYGAHLAASVAVVYGGVGQAPQVRALSRGVDVLVATPGRLLDLHEQGHVRLDQVEILVLDEADHMLDLGFLPDVRRILAALRSRRQTLLFSATMPGPIAELAERFLTRPVKVFVTPAASTVDSVEQRVQHVARADKPALLAELLADRAVERALVFTRTKRGADKVARNLVQAGIPATAIHGNKSQGAREKSLAGFRHGRTRILVATDIAARGIDVDGITHVVNYELPDVAETYVHRIGRTARAGASGVAISLCDAAERDALRNIERLIRRSLPVDSTPRASRASSPAAARESMSGASHAGGDRTNGSRSRTTAKHQGRGAESHPHGSTGRRGRRRQRSTPGSRATSAAHRAPRKHLTHSTPERGSKGHPPAHVRPAAGQSSRFGAGLND
jgi:ATP-dependent RNA helicase RhlE